MFGISFGLVHSTVKYNQNMKWTATKFWLKDITTVIPHFPCSPDLALCDFILFPKLKMAFNKRTINNIPQFKPNCETGLPSFIQCTLLNALHAGMITGFTI